MEKHKRVCEHDWIVLTVGPVLFKVCKLCKIEYTEL